MPSFVDGERAIPSVKVSFYQFDVVFIFHGCGRKVARMVRRCKGDGTPFPTFWEVKSIRALLSSPDDTARHRPLRQDDLRLRRGLRIREAVSLGRHRRERLGGCLAAHG